MCISHFITQTWNRHVLQVEISWTEQLPPVDRGHPSVKLEPVSLHVVLVWCLCPDSCWTFSRFSNVSGNVTTVKESTSQHCFENSFDLSDSLKGSQRQLPSGPCGPRCDNLCSGALPSPWRTSVPGAPSPSSRDQRPLAALSPPLAALSEMSYFPKFSGLGLTIPSLHIVTLLT